MNGAAEPRANGEDYKSQEGHSKHFLGLVY